MDGVNKIKEERNMGILGIENRTENWKTVETFTPFFDNPDGRVRLAQRLLKPLGKSLDFQLEEVQLELFWNGMRDFLKKQPDWKSLPNQDAKIEKFGPVFAELYQREYSTLRTEILGNRMSLPEDFNYNVSGADGKKKLYHHLHGTEFDVVLEAPGYLFVGEGKFMGDFSDNRNGVLKHQLVKQFVVANITSMFLQERGESERVKVVPFVVSDHPEKIREKQQVKFMIGKGCMSSDNILSWDCIEKLSKSSTTS